MKGNISQVLVLTYWRTAVDFAPHLRACKWHSDTPVPTCMSWDNPMLLLFDTKSAVSTHTHAECNAQMTYKGTLLSRYGYLTYRV
jgi:hypothetical protein